MPEDASRSTTLVVGGGVIGLAIARELLANGRRVRVIDQGLCGRGASSVPLAALWPSAATKQGEGHQLHRESLWIFEDFVQRTQAESGLVIPFGRPGRLEIFTNEVRRRAAEAEARAAREAWPSFGNLSVQQVIEPAACEEIEPNVRPSSYGAMQCEATAWVDPVALCAGLRAAIIRAGGEIEEERPVTDLWMDENRVRGVVTDRPVAGDQVVVAAGAHTRFISPELEKGAPVVPVKGQVIVLRPKPSKDAPLFRRLLKMGKTYLIPGPEGNVVVGSTSEREAGFDATATDEAKQDLHRRAAEIVPALAEAEVVGHWVGHRPQTPTRAPYMGPLPGVAGCFVASGHFKIGVALAPAVGKRMAEILEQ